jgi:putative wall associated protein
MKKILLSFLATATILVSCNKNDDTPNNPQQSSNLLKKIIEKDEEGKIDEVRAFTYKNNLLTTIATDEYNNGVQTGTTMITTYSYEGNLLKEMKTPESEVKYYYENGKISIKTEKYTQRTGYISNHTDQYTYEGNQIATILRTQSATVFVNGGAQSGTAHWKKQYTYSGNTITEVVTHYTKDKNGAVIQNYFGSYTKTTVYTIANGNILKVINDEETTEYEYDNHPNPLYEIQQLATIEDIELLLDEENTKNNITKVIRTEQRSSKKKVTTCEYRYNAAGYPIEKKAYKEDNGVRELEGSAEYQY